MCKRRLVGLWLAVVGVAGCPKPPEPGGGGDAGQRCRQLFGRHAFAEPLGQDEIGEITDISEREGFDPLGLAPTYDVVHLESYHHIGHVSIDKAHNRLVSAYDAWLNVAHPEKAREFLRPYAANWLTANPVEKK